MERVFTVTVVRDSASLEAVADEWRDLALNAIEPNSAYEPDTLLPALRELGASEGIRFVLVWVQEMAQGRRELGALFPFRGPVLYRELPVVTLRPYQQLKQRFCTPLLREGCARECMHALLDWFRNDGEGATLLEFRALAGRAPVYRVLAEVAQERNQLVLATRADGRASTLLVGEGSWDELVVSAMPLTRWAKRSVAAALGFAGALR